MVSFGRSPKKSRGQTGKVSFVEIQFYSGLSGFGRWGLGGLEVAGWGFSCQGDHWTPRIRGSRAENSHSVIILTQFFEIQKII